MADPEIAGRSPKMVTLEPGTYNWCSCGRSKTQPFCDGSHEGTEFKPVEFKMEKKGQVALCMCKRTKDQPFCDGSHTKL